MADFTEAQSIIDAARQGVLPTPMQPDERHSLLHLPNAESGQGKLVSVEGYLGRPLRKRGTVEVFDPASFNQVLRDNEGAGDVAIYIDRNPERPAVEAVLNGHGKGGAGWGDLRVCIAFRPTPQWTKWRAIDGKLLAQTDFAEFIEDNLADIVDPPGAAMLEIATHLQATRNVAFRRAVALGSGQVQFENVENLDAKVGPGQIEVPQTPTLSLAPLFGSPAFAVPARFRWRLEDGALRLGVKLQRIEDLMREVLDDVVKKIEVGTNVSVLEGVAPRPVTAL